jgi:hypothetical protein
MGLKDLFYKSSNNEEPEQSTMPVPVPISTPVYSTKYTTPTPTPSVTNEDFSVFYGQLMEVLEEANLPNVQDYIDLKKSLINMQNLPMDEATKFKAVFATLSGAGCDLGELLQSFDYYGNVVDAEKQKFEEAIQSSLSDAVLEKQKTVEQLSKQNEQAASEIQRLTQTMAESQNQIASLQVEICY